VAQPANTGTCYTYDAGRNTLATVKTGTGSSCTSPTTVATYAYDGHGLRMSKTVGATTTGFHWTDGGLPLMLDEKVGSTYTDYVYGPRGNVLEQISGATTVSYSSDNLGSTRAITNSTGTSIATYTTDPYGSVTACTGTTVTVNGSNLCTGSVAVSNPLLFAGQYRDDETGLYYLRARYYEPTSAQFLTVDPLMTQTNAPFSYAGGDPVDAFDPSGRATWKGWQVAGQSCLATTFLLWQVRNAENAWWNGKACVFGAFYDNKKQYGSGGVNVEDNRNGQTVSESWIRSAINTGLKVSIVWTGYYLPPVGPAGAPIPWKYYYRLGQPAWKGLLIRLCQEAADYARTYSGPQPYTNPYVTKIQSWLSTYHSMSLG